MLLKNNIFNLQTSVCTLKMTPVFYLLKFSASKEAAIAAPACDVSRRQRKLK